MEIYGEGIVDVIERSRRTNYLEAVCKIYGMDIVVLEYQWLEKLFYEIIFSLTSLGNTVLFII